MAIERVVSNSSPLMNLAIIGQLDLLRELFGYGASRGLVGIDH